MSFSTKVATLFASNAMYLCWTVIYNLVTKPVTTLLVIFALAQIESIFYYLYHLFAFVRWFNLQQYLEEIVNESENVWEFFDNLYLTINCYYSDNYFDELLDFRLSLIGQWWPHYDLVIPFILVRILSYVVGITAVSLAVRWEARRRRNNWTYKYGYLYLNEPISTNNERMFPHSRLINVDSPDYQAEVFRDFGDGIVHYSGVCFRVADKIYTAGHVVEGSGTTIIQFKEKKVTIPTHLWIQEQYDVAHLPYAYLASLNMKSAKQSQAIPTPQSVKIVARGQATYGILRDHEVMGMLTYDGSTVAGFSGAPYCVGNIVLGIHTGHQTTENVGVAFSYINLIIKRAERGYKKEDTEDYFDYELSRAGKQGFNYRRDPYHPDEYLVRVAGKYHMVDSEVFDKISKKYQANEDNTMREYEAEKSKRARNGSTQNSEVKPVIIGSNPDKVDLRTSAAKVNPEAKTEPINKIDSNSFLEMGPHSKPPPVPPRRLAEKVKELEKAPMPRSSLTYESATASILEGGRFQPKPAQKKDVAPPVMPRSRGTPSVCPIVTKPSVTDLPELTHAQLSDHLATTPRNNGKRKTGSAQRRLKQLKQVRMQMRMIMTQLTHAHGLLKSLNIDPQATMTEHTLSGSATSASGGAHYNPFMT